jgi:hypothetical protein
VLAEALDLRPALVVLDALYLFAPTSREAGNDASAMAPVMAQIDGIAVQSGAAVLLVAHTNKSDSDVAGSYVVRAKAKGILRLGLPNGEDSAEDGPASPRRLLTVESKLTAGTKVALELHGPGDWRYLGAPADVRAIDLRGLVLDHLDAGGEGTADEIARALRKRKHEVERVLVAAVENGAAAASQERTGGRPRTVYRAPTFSPAAPHVSSLGPEASNGYRESPQPLPRAGRLSVRAAAP